MNGKRSRPDMRVHLLDEVRIPPMDIGDHAAHYERQYEGDRCYLTRTSMPSLMDHQSIDIPIIYEDRELLVINKPTKLAVYGQDISVLSVLSHRYEFLELIHRLDYETSGCLMLAKKSSALRKWHEALRLRQIVKQYDVLVYGRWDDQKKLIEHPVKKTRKNEEIYVKIDHKFGKTAKTEILSSAFIDHHYSRLRIQLHTGRTHQIRVHVAHEGHPVIGDMKYGPRDLWPSSIAVKTRRLCLHACRVQWQDYVFKAPTPF